MLIALEGNEGSGKTTLAKKIAQLIREQHPDQPVYEIHARAPRTDNPWSEYVTPLNGYRPGCGWHYVLDRWHWGEEVYPSIVGRSAIGSPESRKDVAEHLSVLGMVVAYLPTTPANCLHRIAVRGDDEPYVQWLDKIHQAYIHQVNMAVRHGETVFISDDAENIVTYARMIEES